MGWDRESVWRFGVHDVYYISQVLEAEFKKKKSVNEMRLMKIGTHPIGISRILLHLYPLRLHLDRRAGTELGFLLGFAAAVRVEFAE